MEVYLRSLGSPAYSNDPGMPKDLLWTRERCYGYTRPARDNNGDRVHSGYKLHKSIEIRQLAGKVRRPGRLLSLNLPKLKTLLQSLEVELDAGRLVNLLAADDMVTLQSWFENQLIALGLQAFVHRVMAPSTVAIGEAWASDRLAIYQ